MKKIYTTPVLQEINSIVKMTQASSGSSQDDGGSDPKNSPNKVS